MFNAQVPNAAVCTYSRKCLHIQIFVSHSTECLAAGGGADELAVANT